MQDQCTWSNGFLVPKLDDITQTRFSLLTDRLSIDHRAIATVEIHHPHQGSVFPMLVPTPGQLEFQVCSRHSAIIRQ